MDYKKFLLFNVLGGLIWAVGVTALGYFLGNIIPDVDKYLLPIAALIILVSIAPALWHLLKDQEKRAEYLNRIKQSASKIKSSKGRRSSK